jgi:hypothetical protein
MPTTIICTIRRISKEYKSKGKMDTNTNLNIKAEDNVTAFDNDELLLPIDR